MGDEIDFENQQISIMKIQDDGRHHEKRDK